MACTGHCWVRVYQNGAWYLQCLNCPELRPE
jgi:hypothetical protein